MFGTIKTILSLLKKKQKIFLFFVLLFETLFYFAEFFTIATIIPIFISYISNNQINELGHFKIYNFFNSLPKIQIIFFFVTIITIKIIFSFFIFYKKIVFFKKLTYELTEKTLKNYLNLNFLDQMNFDGALLFRNVMTEIKNLVLTIEDLIKLITNIFSIIIAFLIILLISFSVELLFFFFIFIFLIFFLYKKYKKYLVEIGAGRVEFNKKAVKYLLDLIAARVDLKILKRINIIGDYFFDSLKKNLSYVLKDAIIRRLPSFFYEIIFISIFSSVILLYVMKDDIFNNAVIAKTLIGLVLLYRINPLIISIQSSLNILSLRKFGNDIYKKLSDNKKNILKKNFYYKFKSLELKNISFKFNNNIIFENFNLKIKKGDKILIRGKSGVGKTTLIKIILGIIPPDSGSIYINDKKLPKISNANIFFDNVGYAGQNTYLFDKSIRFNVCLQDPNVNENKYSLALHVSRLQGLVKTKKPVPIGSNGDLISQGEKQRVGIARALYNAENIIVFDECTSNLDQKNERLFYKNFFSEYKNLTSIFISHTNKYNYYFSKIIDL